MYQYRHILWGLSVGLFLMPVVEAKAQLLPDNTLGKEKSVVNSLDSLQKIDGGAIRGSNLFHSFKEFNIGNAQSVYFSNPGTIENILTRVTGKNPSAIFGKLGVLGNANLFLLNPNGIIFGQDASLDISGSFSATTSSSILFDNGFEFSATNPQAPPLLKVNITPGLQYPRSQQGHIVNQGNLTVGKDLNLVGRNLDLTGELNASRDINLTAQDDLKIRDSSNNPFIANAGRNLLLQANQKIDIFALNHADSGLYSGNNLLMQSANPVLGDARYFSGGSFSIEQLDGNLGDLESPNDPIIRASGDVNFDSYIGASLHILAGGNVNITGDVTITGADDENGLEETITLSNGESLEINGKNQATLDIRAGTTAFGTPGITGSGSFTPDNPNTGGIGSNSDIVIGGNIKVETADGLVFLTNQHNVDTSLNNGNIQIQGDIFTSSALGNGGRVIVDSSNDIEITGNIRSNSRFDAGNILINASGKLDISSQIKANSRTGVGGKISLSSGSNLSMFNGADIDSQSKIDNVTGNSVIGKDIILTAPSIILEDASRVTVGITGAGTSGDLIVEAEDIQIFDGSGLSSITQGLGDVGDINITTQRLLIQNSLPEPDTIDINNINDYRTGISTYISRLPEDISFNSNYFKSGEGGDITINASESIKLIGNKNGAFSPTLKTESLASIQLDTAIFSGTTGSGEAGDININTGQLAITNGAGISTSSISPASLSTIFPDLVPSLAGGLNDDSMIQTINDNLAKITDAGNSGGLNINANEIELMGQGGFTTATLSSGNAGNLIINNTEQFTLKDGAIVTTSTFSSGNAGNLQINTDKLQVSSGSLVAAGTLNQGQGGDLKITASDSVEVIGTSDDGKLGSSIRTTAEENSTGNAGELEVDAPKLIISNGADILASTLSTQSGDIILQGLNTVEVNNGQISASTVDGEAGDIIINATDSIQILNSSGITSEATGKGTAGFLNITTGQLDITDNSQASVNSEEAAGDLLVNAENIIIRSESKLTAETKSGSSGNIKLQNLQSLLLRGGSLISAKTEDGEAGDIIINASEQVRIQGNSTISSAAVGEGEAGFLEIITDKLNISNSSKVTVGSPRNGDSGLILIQASDVNLTDDAKILAKTVLGDGGDILLENLKNLSLSQGSFISATTTDGEAGNIEVNATDSIKIENESKLESESIGNGIAGNITITTNQLTISDNSQANVSNQANGSAGSILINASDVFLSDTAEIAAKTQESGSDGNISFENLNSLELFNSQISASTVNGEAGDININATASVKLIENSKLASEAKGDGIAGELFINTNQLIISDNSQANVSSQGNGSAGSILINASDVFMSNTAEINATTAASGTDGNITFESLNSLELFDSKINASTINGEAGDININATDSVKLFENSRIESKAIGDGIAGELNINTNQLTISDNSQVNVSSKNDGTSGDVLINAMDISLNEKSTISATTESGIGGNIVLEGLTSLLINSSEISASTIDGEAGNLNINVAESIELSGKGGFSVQSTEGGTAGSVSVNTSQFNISDEAQVTVSSKLGQAGNLEITADNLFLNQGILTAETGVGEGEASANINLNIQNLLMMLNNSLISAEAFDTANGGNISINNSQGFVVGLPFENSDIIANATQGNGGNINITTQNIFGLEFREQRTDKSDITASSKFGLSGQVTVNQLDLNPAFALIELPSNVNNTNAIKTGCSVSTGNNFVISGRSGLPQNPHDLFDRNTILVELVDAVVGKETTSNIVDGNLNSISAHNQKNQIIEATGWIKDADGGVIFIAQLPPAHGRHGEISQASCQDFSAVNQ